MKPIKYQYAIPGVDTTTVDDTSGMYTPSITYQDIHDIR